MYEFNTFQIVNTKIVLENKVLRDSNIYVKNGIIRDIGKNFYKNIKTIDGKGNYIIPGFVDLHCDFIEKEIEVRPNVYIPTEIAIREIDRKMAVSGITTIFHSLSFSETSSSKAVLRTISMADKIIYEIKEVSKNLKVDNRIHLRYEITCPEALPVIEKLAKEKLLDLISIMDHTPGQGQFKTHEQFKNYYRSHFKDNFHQIEKVIKNKKKSRELFGLYNIKRVSELCKIYNIPLASHDDDTIEKVNFVSECGAVISEYPTNMDVAAYAHDSGLNVLVGAPNILRGNSHNNNLKAMDVIKEGKADIVCSGYLPSALVYAFAKIYKENIMPINELVKLFSLNPARVVGLDKEIGKIETGYKANFILLDLDDELPEILKTFVNGLEVYSSCKVKKLA